MYLIIYTVFIVYSVQPIMYKFTISDRQWYNTKENHYIQQKLIFSRKSLAISEWEDNISFHLYRVRMVQCTTYIVQYTLYIVQCTPYIVQCTACNIQCTMYNEKRLFILMYLVRVCTRSKCIHITFICCQSICLFLF